MTPGSAAPAGVDSAPMGGSATIVTGSVASREIPTMVRASETGGRAVHQVNPAATAAMASPMAITQVMMMPVARERSAPSGPVSRTSLPSNLSMGSRLGGFLFRCLLGDEHFEG